MLSRLNKTGSVVLNGEVISNVRDLCLELNISSYSLYDWANKRGVELNIKKTKTKPKKVKKSPLVLDSSDVDFIEGNSSGSDIFGIRFWGFVAKNLKIVNYHSVPLNQLKLKIGIKLMKESGLVDTIGD
jgi:hypothetical protein